MARKRTYRAPTGCRPATGSRGLHGRRADPHRVPRLGHRPRLDRARLHHLGRHRPRPIKWVGLQNFRDLSTSNPQFWPAVQHNVIWFVVLILIPTPLGLFLAVLVDRTSGTRVYQTAFFLPVVVSLASPASSGSWSTTRTGPDQQPRRGQPRGLHRLDRRPEPQPVGRPGRRRPGGTPAT